MESDLREVRRGESSSLSDFFDEVLEQQLLMVNILRGILVGDGFANSGRTFAETKPPTG
jgi:hypothetical protein